jgi:hypothetical protein
LARLLRRTDYVYFLARHVTQIGIRVNDQAFLLGLDASSREISLKICDEPNLTRPAFWVECDLGALESAVREEKSVSELVVRTGPLGQVVHPRVEQLLLRCFEAPPYPIDDRESLVYASLFGFSEPHVLWESKRQLLRVLQYRQDERAAAYCVTSGISEPWAWQPAHIYGSEVSGAGYELVIKSNIQPVIREFVSWAQYIEDTGAHLLPGNWLEFEQGKIIPGTNIAGFLVVKPTSFLPYFPTGSSIANWHSLVPVASRELKLAKETDAFHVADMVPYEDRC